MNDKSYYLIEQFANMSDYDLIKVISEKAKDYTEEALLIAEAELKKRKDINPNIEITATQDEINDKELYVSLHKNDKKRAISIIGVIMGIFIASILIELVIKPYQYFTFSLFINMVGIIILYKILEKKMDKVSVFIVIPICFMIIQIITTLFATIYLREINSSILDIVAILIGLIWVFNKMNVFSIGYILAYNILSTVINIYILCETSIPAAQIESLLAYNIIRVFMIVMLAIGIMEVKKNFKNEYNQSDN